MMTLVMSLILLWDCHHFCYHFLRLWTGPAASNL